MWTLFSADTWSVVVTGLLVVFVALVGLVLILIISGAIFKSISNKKNKPSDTESESDTSSAVAEDNFESVIEVLVADESEEENVVAAITAAIACLFEASGNDKPFSIKSIRRKKDTKNAWNNASVVENTRPF